MKLNVYRLCRLCDRAIHGRGRWLCLGAAAVCVLLCLLGLTWLALPVLLLCAPVLALYLLHRAHAFGACYQRTPRPEDALCETILIDAELIGQGTRLRAAAQPIDTAEALSLRLGSGALLLGTAMTLTADDLPPADRAAILSAVHQLNIRPDRMRSQYPVISRVTEGGVTVVTVRDAVSQRRCYLAEPELLLPLCPMIWEGHTRPMTAEDPLRIADTARYIAQGNCRVLAWATALGDEPPVFLGMAGLGESLRMEAVQELSALRGMGLTVMLHPGEASGEDAQALRTLLELPDHHARADIHLTTRMTDQPGSGGGPALGVTRVPGESLLEPVVTLRRRFRTMEDTLQRFALLLGVPAALALLCGVTPAALAAAALMLFTAVFLGVDLSVPLPRWQVLAAAGLTALVAKAFLLTQGAALSAMGGSVLTVTVAAACAVRLCGQAFRLRGLPLVLPGAGLLGCLIAVLCTLSQGAALLLPLGFSLLTAAIIALLMLLERDIFK